MVIQDQNEKALFLQCHIVVIAVKLIYGTGIGNNVMDGVGLMEGLINSIKPLYFVVASITIKLRIPAKKTNISQVPIN
jgi:hypothetical protein